MNTKLEIREGPPGGEQHIFLNGRLDASWSGYLDDYLNGLVREGSYRIVVNMKDVQYLSSAGISVLFTQYKKIKKIGGLFLLEELSDQVSEVLKMVGMINILTQDTQEATPADKEKTRSFEIKGYRFSHETLYEGTMAFRKVGNPDLALTAGYTEADNHKIRSTASLYGLGIGAIGEGFDDCKSRYGEFLALGDAVVYKPSDGSKIPDYVVKAGKLEPEINALSALTAEGPFTHLVTFDSMAAGGSIALSDLTDAFSKTTGLDKFAFLLIGESSGLVGVSLSAPPVEGRELFGFPGIRETVNFTTEPAYPRMLAVLFGVFDPQPDEILKPFLRPVKPESNGQVHAHAVVFPFQALPKKITSANQVILHLFETSIAEDVLHLVHDSREIAGLGESTFRQGVAWIGKLR